jgi:hypothetical protein
MTFGVALWLKICSNKDIIGKYSEIFLYLLQSVAVQLMSFFAAHMVLHRCKKYLFIGLGSDFYTAVSSVFCADCSCFSTSEGQTGTKHVLIPFDSHRKILRIVRWCHQILH